MALRSLGSSLLAKNKPGTAFREQKTRKIETPKLPEKGEIGTVRRDLVQEPLERKVPPGSDKVVTAKPTIDETTVPGEAQEGQRTAPNLLGGNGKVVGFPGGNAPAQAGGAFTSAVAPNNVTSPPRVASQAAPGGRTATSVSGGEAPGAAPASGRGQVQGAQTTAKAPDTVKRVSFLPSVFSSLSGRAIADDPGKAPETVESRGAGDTGVVRSGSNVEFTPTTGQFLSGAIGKLIDTVGRATGNIAPETNLSERLERFGGAVQPAIAGQGSISSIFDNLRSRAKGFSSRLRSLFRR